MSSLVKKAMVLSAGLGTRLSPITKKLPKPLVSVLNIPNILHILYLLKRAGISEVVMNLHHLSKEMEGFFTRKKYFDLQYSFTYENPILGTGGGVKNAQSLLGDSTFVLANCDFVTNINVGTFIERHIQKKSKASMILIQDETRQNLYSKVGVNSQERLVSLPKLQTEVPTQYGIFTGIHILDSDIFNYLENRPCGINDVLYPILMDQFSHQVHGFIDRKSFWYDTGDLPAFLSTSRALLNELQSPNSFIHDVFAHLGVPLKEIQPLVWTTGDPDLNSVKLVGPILLGDNIRLGKNIKLGPYTVVGDHSVIEDSVSIEGSVILPGALITSGTHLNDIIQFESLSVSTKPTV